METNKPQTPHIQLSLDKKTMDPEKKKKILITVSVLLGIVILYGITVSWKLQQAYSLGVNGKNELLSARENMYALDFITAQENFRKANTDLKNARKKVTSIRLARIFLKKQIEAANNILSTGISLASAFEQGSLLADKVKSIVGPGSTSYADLSPQTRLAILAMLQDSKDDLAHIQKNVSDAAQNLSGVDSDAVGAKIFEQIKPVQEALPVVAKEISLVTEVIDALPELLGFYDAKNYFFILQNDMELRPAGGLASTYGIITIKDGTLESFQTYDTYLLDRDAEKTITEPAVQPIQKYVGRTKLLMRDSNWSADFPTSARLLQSAFYRESINPPAFDGIIGTTPVVFSNLLDIFGPTIVDGKEITEESLRTDLDIEVREKSATNYETRKTLFQLLSDDIRNRLFTLPINNYVQIIQMLGNALEQKDVQLFSLDPIIQQSIVTHGWAGTMSETTNDYIMVVDASMANIQKIDRMIDRNISYDLLATNDEDTKQGLFAKLDIRYQNNSDQDQLRVATYKSYTRIYLPQGIQLLNTSGMEDMTVEEIQEGTVIRTVIGGYFAVSAGEEHQILIAYRLPHDIEERLSREKQYSLTIQKQSGTQPKININTEFAEDIKTVNANLVQQPIIMGHALSTQQTMVRDSEITIYTK